MELESNISYEELQSEIYALIERAIGEEIDCGNKNANSVANEFLNNFIYPVDN